MSADNLALLFRLRGDASGLRTAAQQGQQAVNQLKQQFGPELAQTVSATNKAFSEVGIGIGNLTQRIPVVGTAVNRLTDLLRNAGVQGKTTEQSVSRLATAIGNISRESGKSIPQVSQFLTRFTQIAGAAERDSAAVEFFGASLATKLVPQLASARVALAGVTAESAAAGAGLAGIALPIAAAVIAVAALVAGLALVSRELFDVTKNAAAFQGKMQDLSQSTGVAVETLSALEVAAKTTGGNLDGLAASLGIFQRNMEEALDPTSKAAREFEQLGVTVTDTETTLRDTLSALARMPEGFQQTALALQLFGRGGRQVLAILKETNGDLDAFQQKLRDAGLLISGEAARAADKFNDQLDLLGFETRSAGAALAEDLVEPMTDVIRGTSELVRAFKPLLSVLGTLAGPTVSATASSLKGLGLVVQVLTFDYKGLSRSIREAREEAAKGIPKLNIPDLRVPLPDVLTEAQATREAAAEASEAVAAVKRAAAETNQVLNTAFEQGRINRQRQVNEIIDSNRRVLDAEKARITAEVELENDKWKQIRDRQDLAESEKQKLLEESAGKVRKLQQEDLNAQSLFDITSRELQARAAKERADSLRAQKDNETNILIGGLDRRIAATERAIAQETQTEANGLKVIERLEREKIDVRRKSFEEQKRIGFLTIEERKLVDQQIAALDQEAKRLQDEQQARREQRQREHSARILQLKLQEIQSLLEAERLAGESTIAAIQAQAALRIRTEENAAREVLRIRLQLIDDETEAVKAQLEASKGITGLAERTQVQAELNAQLRILTAQRMAIQASGNRDIDASRQRDLDNERDYADELQDIREQAIDVQRDAAEEVVRLMQSSFARRRDIIRAERDLDIQKEEDRHRRETERIRAQQQETDAEIRILEKRLERLKIGTSEEIEEHDRIVSSLERLRAKRAELDARQEAEDSRSQTRKRRVTVEADFELADPDIALQDVFDDIAESVTGLSSKFAELIGLGKEFNAVSAQIAQQLGGMLAGAFNQFADALGQTVANWVLLGETGPAVMRKILAQALASLAAEAAVQSIKELALGFASLFFNPAESAAHFTAAGLWAAVAGGAALAGRGIAGDLFKQKSATGGGTGAGGSRGTGDRDEARPIDLTRPRVDEIHVFFHPEPGARFSDAVVTAVVDDVQRNGPARDVIQRTAGG